MDDRVSRFRKSARKVASALKAMNAAIRAANRSSPNWSEVQDLAVRASRELGSLEGLESLASELGSDFEGQADRAETAARQDRALLAGQTASLLMDAGIPVTGNLPHLRAGVFTLAFDFDGKGRCVVWFGPRKQKLFPCPMDPQTIAGKVSAAHKRLFDTDWDEMAFLADMESAYRVTLVRLGLTAGEKVPLTSLLAEVAFQRQDVGFHSDPRRELFSSFGRVEFAVALSRLRSWRLGDREFRMGVATMAQTHRPENHLWVPDRRGMEGTNYAMASFVHVPLDESDVKC